MEWYFASHWETIFLSDFPYFVLLKEGREEWVYNDESIILIYSFIVRMGYSNRKTWQKVLRMLLQQSQTMYIYMYYICSKWKCTDICHLDKAKMVEDKKFQHKWLFDPTMAKCSHTGTWCLTYIDGLGMFCAVCWIKMSLSQKMSPRFGTQSPMLDIKQKLCKDI